MVNRSIYSDPYRLCVFCSWELKLVGVLSLFVQKYSFYRKIVLSKVRFVKKLFCQTPSLKNIAIFWQNVFLTKRSFTQQTGSDNYALRALFHNSIYALRPLFHNAICAPRALFHKAFIGLKICRFLNGRFTGFHRFLVQTDWIIVFLRLRWFEIYIG